MLIQELEHTIIKLTEHGKGILAADESPTTLGKRFAALNIECTAESRRDYRELLFTTVNLNQYIAGVILHEETLVQNNRAGIPLITSLQANNILVGIKVDKGLVALNCFGATVTTAESLTQGIDHLAERLTTYKEQGASFAKWRAIYKIGNASPSDMVIRANADALALYAAICQGQGIVPIVEPEVLLDGDHSIEECAYVTQMVLVELFAALRAYGVILEFMILKPSMVMPGKNCQTAVSVEKVAATTVMVLRRTVPAAVASINFLSGGQSALNATAHLNAMNSMDIALPWPLSYSYARALQDQALQLWQGLDINIAAAQQSLIKRAELNTKAVLGSYQEEMEQDAVIITAS